MQVWHLVIGNRTAVTSTHVTLRSNVRSTLTLTYKNFRIISLLLGLSYSSVHLAHPLAHTHTHYSALFVRVTPATSLVAVAVVVVVLGVDA